MMASEEISGIDSSIAMLRGLYDELGSLFGGFDAKAAASEIDAALKDLSKTGKTKTWLKKLFNARLLISEALEQAPGDPVLTLYMITESLLDTGRVQLEGGPPWTKIVSQQDNARAYLAPADDDTLKTLRTKLKLAKQSSNQMETYRASSERELGIIDGLNASVPGKHKPFDGLVKRRRQVQAKVDGWTLEINQLIPEIEAAIHDEVGYQDKARAHYAKNPDDKGHAAENLDRDHDTVMNSGQSDQSIENSCSKYLKLWRIAHAEKTLGGLKKKGARFEMIEMELEPIDLSSNILKASVKGSGMLSKVDDCDEDNLWGRADLVFEVVHTASTPNLRYTSVFKVTSSGGFDIGYNWTGIELGQVTIQRIGGDKDPQLQ
jgi:hypothetical protein